MRRLVAPPFEECGETMRNVHHPWGQLATRVGLALPLALACGDGASSPMEDGGTLAGDAAADLMVGDEGVEASPNECDEALVDPALFAQLDGFEGAGPCGAAGATLTGSFTNLDGLSLQKVSFFTGEETTVEPCIEALCDADFAYVAVNNGQHWEYQIGPPNADPSISLFKLRLVPEAANPAAGDIDELDLATSCVAAYDQYLADPDTGTTTEPSGACFNGMGGGGAPFFTGFDEGVEVPVRRLACVGTNGCSVSGTTLHGSSEAAVPDPWGNPAYLFPDTGDGDYKGEVGGDGMMGAFPTGPRQPAEQRRQVQRRRRLSGGAASPYR
ncbi:MAG: hypothetical protein AAF447_06975 [Myxococcota bacterium]